MTSSQPYHQINSINLWDDNITSGSASYPSPKGSKICPVQITELKIKHLSSYFVFVIESTTQVIFQTINRSIKNMLHLMFHILIPYLDCSVHHEIFQLQRRVLKSKTRERQGKRQGWHRICSAELFIAYFKLNHFQNSIRFFQSNNNYHYKMYCYRIKNVKLYTQF